MEKPLDGRRQRNQVGHGPLRSTAYRRYNPLRGQNRRNGYRRGQDPCGHAACVPALVVGSRRARGDGQRLPRQARLRVDGSVVHVPRSKRGLHRQAPAQHPRTPPRLRMRYHIRHQQRVRLRLPPRQYGDGAGRPRAAQALLCYCRRG
ncbi:hypothetical protein IMSAGC008_02303 [Muribaculaceae bacterium]|nr:hypothetical protein IMSAGC008_02303 [Muribaculaceae bacterium]